MAEPIRKKAFSGFAWTFIQNIAVKVLIFVFTIFLTRLLTPEDYGLIGMLSIFIAVSDVFIQSGFGQALVQKKDCTDEDFSTAFYFNVAIAILIYVILFVSAPLIASFYREPQLVLLTRVLSINFVIGSLNIVQRSKLTRAMEFKPLAIITLIGTLIGGVVGVSMALFEFGVWSLVGQTLSGTLVSVLIFPLFTKWKPNKHFNIQSFKNLWGYGSKLLIAGSLDVVVRNFSNIIIGKYYNKEQVGYFSRARTFAEIPAETMASVLGSVMFPLLSEIQSEEERIKAVYKKVFNNTILISFPVIVMLMMLSKPLVVILFTEKWLPCVPLLQALLLARIFLPLNYLNSSFLHGTGRVNLYMKLYFIAAPFSLFAIIISIPLGVQAMAWATFIASLLYYFVFAIYVGRIVKYNLIEQFRENILVIFSLIIMSFSVLMIVHFVSNIWLQLVVGFTVGSIIYLACCVLFKLVDANMIVLIKNKIGIEKNKENSIS